MTTETVGGADTGFTTERVSFITDDILVQRYVEIEGVLRTVIVIHKMRGSNHSHDFLMYDINANGAVIGGPLRNYRGIITGIPERQHVLARSAYDDLTEGEERVLDTLVRMGEVKMDMLAERLGLGIPELSRMLERIVSLNYASMSEKGGGSYRAVAQRAE